MPIGRFGSLAAPFANISLMAALEGIADVNSAKMLLFGGPLSAEAVSKLHNFLTPEVAFKHNVRRY